VFKKGGKDCRRGWGFSSVVERLPSKRKALGSVPISEKKKKKKKKDCRKHPRGGGLRGRQRRRRKGERGRGGGGELGGRDMPLSTQGFDTVFSAFSVAVVKYSDEAI